jgi:hypothetical protein
MGLEPSSEMFVRNDVLLRARETCEDDQGKVCNLVGTLGKQCRAERASCRSQSTIVKPASAEQVEIWGEQSMSSDSERARRRPIEL